MRLPDRPIFDRPIFGIRKSKRSSAEFFASFNKDNQRVVNKVAAFYRKKGGRVIGHVDEILVAMGEIERGKEPQAEVYVTEKVGRNGYTLEGVNWDKPELNPNDYKEYALDFLNFSGPAAKQQLRAQLLATALQVPIIFRPRPI